ncbi:MAG: ketosteroid isomerase-related protein [Polyangiales bacterium]|nr:nuclear transport factor 2 family protein [Sandaracinaceae bacterium]
MTATELVQAYYAAFNADDMPAFLALLADDVVHDVNQGERQVGATAFASFMAKMSRCYRERLSDIVVMQTPDGTRAAAEFVVHGEYMATDEGLPAANGQTYTLPAGAFFEIADGRITRVTNYYNLPAWTAQVAG